MASRALKSAVEVLPEADRLADYPHPRQTQVLYGHKAACVELSAAINSKTMHHAWLLTGKEGIGKATLAYKAAVYALADPNERMLNLTVCAGTINERQVAQLSHPGLYVIRRNYDVKTKRFPTTITIDEVRKLRSFLSHRHSPGHWRVIIIDRADELNINAANALLKSLEEPPEQTVFFLTAIDTGKLLPTIRSRCRLLALRPLSNEHLIAAAQAAYSFVCHNEERKEPVWQDLLAPASGSARRLLTLASDNGAELAHAVDLIYQSLETLNIGFLHTLADRLASNQATQDYDLFLSLLLEKLADLIKAAAMQSEARNNQPSNCGSIKPEQLATWAELWETLHREEREVRTLNLDRAAFLLDVFARLNRAAINSHL